MLAIPAVFSCLFLFLFIFLFGRCRLIIFVYYTRRFLQDIRILKPRIVQEVFLLFLRALPYLARLKRRIIRNAEHFFGDVFYFDHVKNIYQINYDRSPTAITSAVRTDS